MDSVEETLMIRPITIIIKNADEGWSSDYSFL